MSFSPPESPTARPGEPMAGPFAGFLKWCDQEQIELAQISPGLAGRFIRDLPVSTATKNQTLAAMRNFFDTLVQRHAVVLNPFNSVRGLKHKVLDGKTPELTIPPGAAAFLDPGPDRPGRTPRPRLARHHAHHRLPCRGPRAAPRRRPAPPRRRAGSSGFEKKEGKNARSRCATTWTNGSRNTCRPPA